MPKLILAVPRGRILKSLNPLLERCQIKAEAAFRDPDSRKLRFASNHEDIDIIRVRPFDVASFVAFGAAQMGIVGSDVLAEFDYDQIYAPLDCRIGRCRLVLATTDANTSHYGQASHIRVATKYPNTTQHHFARRGIQAECIKLHGAIEIAPSLGLAPYIVDLVSSGQTLAANGLSVVETIADVSARLIINRTAYKTRAGAIKTWLDAFTRAVKEETPL